MDTESFRATPCGDIEAFSRWLSPVLDASIANAANTVELSKSCCRDLEALASECLPECHWRALPFGSSANGFGTGGSDLDVTLCSTSDYSKADLPDLEMHVQVLKALRKALRKSDRGKHFVLQLSILRARIPLLKLTYKGVLEVDLSIENLHGIRNSRLLRAYASMGDDIMQLGIAVKLWAKGQRVCGAWKGHLSAYAFVLMTIYFLQVTSYVKLPCLQNWEEGFEDDAAAAAAVEAAASLRADAKHGVATLLCLFFSFYTDDYEWGTEVVSIRFGRRMETTSSHFNDLDLSPDTQLCIEDPFELWRNLCDVLRQEDELREALQAANEAAQARQHLLIWQSLIGLDSMVPVSVGLVTVAICDYRGEVGRKGYMPVSAGDCLEILHVDEPDNTDKMVWMYARRHSSGREGWLPCQVALPELCIFRSVPPRSASAELQQVLRIPAVAIVDVTAAHDGYLPLLKGQDVTVLFAGSEKQEDCGWFFGRTSSGQGWFPAAAVTPASGSEVLCAFMQEACVQSPGVPADHAVTAAEKPETASDDKPEPLDDPAVPADQSEMLDAVTLVSAEN